MNDKTDRMMEDNEKAKKNPLGSRIPSGNSQSPETTLRQMTSHADYITCNEEKVNTSPKKSFFNTKQQDAILFTHAGINFNGRPLERPDFYTIGSAKLAELWKVDSHCGWFSWQDGTSEPPKKTGQDKAGTGVIALMKKKYAQQNGGSSEETPSDARERGYNATETGKTCSDTSKGKTDENKRNIKFHRTDIKIPIAGHKDIIYKNLLSDEFILRHAEAVQKARSRIMQDPLTGKHVRKLGGVTHSKRYNREKRLYAENLWETLKDKCPYWWFITLTCTDEERKMQGEQSYKLFADDVKRYAHELTVNYKAKIFRVIEAQTDGSPHCHLIIGLPRCPKKIDMETETGKLKIGDWLKNAAESSGKFGECNVRTYDKKDDISYILKTLTPSIETINEKLKTKEQALDDYERSAYTAWYFCGRANVNQISFPRLRDEKLDNNKSCTVKSAGQDVKAKAADMESKEKQIAEIQKVLLQTFANDSKHCSTCANRCNCIMARYVQECIATWTPGKKFLYLKDYIATLIK